MTKVLGIEFKTAVVNLYYQTISWIQMALRKITTDSSVKYIAQSEQTSERDSKTNRIKINSLPRWQNKKLSQKKIGEDIITGEGFRYLKE